MSEQLPVSAIHPLAPEFLSAAVLYQAPIDLEAAVARINTIWNESVEPVWESVPAGQLGAGSSAGRIYRFTLEGILVMLTPVPEKLQVERGNLPDHSFYVAITCFAPLGDQAGNGEIGEVDDLPSQRRKRMLTAHVVLTELLDVLLREPAVVGVYRQELGVVQPPEMIIELANSLTQGQAPLPLWVAVRTFRPDLANGRTLGLPLFGHLDLEVVESVRSDEELYSLLANISDYIVSSDAFLMPGQTIGYRDGEELQITQGTSPTDGSAVLRIQY